MSLSQAADDGMKNERSSSLDAKCDGHYCRHARLHDDTTPSLQAKIHCHIFGRWPSHCRAVKAHIQLLPLLLLIEYYAVKMPPNITH